MSFASFPSARTLVVGAFGLAIGAGALWLSLRDVSKTEVLSSLQEISLLPLTASLLVYLSATAIRGIRWHRLLKHRTDRTFKTAQTLYVGYAVNNILPARLGEFFRIEYAHRRLRIERGYCTGALIGERSIDLACLGFVLLLGLVLLPKRHIDARVNDLANVGGTFAILLIAAVAIVALIIRFGAVSPAPARSDPPAVRSWWRRLTVRLLGELRYAQYALRAHGRRELAVICALSVLVWGFEGAALYLVGVSLNLSIPFAGVALLLFVASLATLVPSAPGYIGTFQLAFVVALSFVGISPTAAVTAATVQQVVNIGFATLVGLLFFLMPMMHAR